MENYTYNVIPSLVMKTMSIGFTGTRHGMTTEQVTVLTDFFQNIKKRDKKPYFHYGQCIGADTQAFMIADHFGLITVAHPPIDKKYWVFTPSIEQREDKEYLERDRNIVDSSHVLFGCPKEKHEVTRGSGTWYTIRYARKNNKPIVLIYPSGSVEWFNFNTLMYVQ